MSPDTTGSSDNAPSAAKTGISAGLSVPDTNAALTAPKRSRTPAKSSYGRGFSRYSDKARRIFQSSRADPGGYRTREVLFARPNAPTYVAVFSAYDKDGRMTSAANAVSDANIP